MRDMDEATARELLRRLDGVIGDVDGEDLDDEADDELPSAEEARAELDRIGFDVPAALARLQARIAAFDPAAQRAARRRRQIVGAGLAATAAACTAAGIMWWRAPPADDIEPLRRSLASTPSSAGRSLARSRDSESGPRALSPAPSVSAASPDAGAGPETAPRRRAP